MVSDYYPFMFVLGGILLLERQKMLLLLFVLVGVTAFGYDGLPVSLVPWLMYGVPRIVARVLEAHKDK